MRKILLITFLILSTNLIQSQNILISEIADPNSTTSCRFVEIFCHGPGPCDMSGLQLARWTNGNSDPTGSSLVPLSGLGTLLPNQIAVISNNSAPNGAFLGCYGFNPNITAGTGGPADSNGDDQIAIVDGALTIIDIFGVPGEDGTGTCHEFEDGRAERKSSVTISNPTFNEAEWNVWADSSVPGCTSHINMPQETSNMDPLTSILPVTLTKFRFQISNKTIRLLWTTESEINNDYFQIERSANGKDFVALDKVHGFGNSLSTRNYEFIDESPLNGSNYYRLKQVDFDGRFEYTKIIRADNSDSRIRIYPTSTTDYVTVDMNEDQVASVTIINTVGQVVKNMNITEMKTSIDISNIPSGIYYVTVDAQSGKEIKKIIKQ